MTRKVYINSPTYELELTFSLILNTGDKDKVIRFFDFLFEEEIYPIKGSSVSGPAGCSMTLPAEALEKVEGWLLTEGYYSRGLL